MQAIWDQYQTLIRIGLILVGSLAARWILLALVRRTTRKIEKANHGQTARVVQRARTMSTVLSNLITWTLILFALASILSELGVAVGALVASAGIVGAAVGFGAQTLVRDFLSGIFIIFEDQYGIGDKVDLGEASGVIESVGLRVTQVRDAKGTLWYVRNGEIIRVGNLSQGKSKK